MIELNVLSMSQLNNLFLYVFVSFALTFILIPLIIKIAFSFNVVDTPDGILKTHEKKIPYLGGISIYLGFFSTLIIFLFFNPVNLVHFILFFLGSTSLVLIGFFDDLYVLSPLQKILGQIFSSIFFIFLIILLHGNYYLIPFYLFWLLSSINAFNLIDVMDGLATTVGICTSISFFTYSLIFGQLFWAKVILIFIGALAAFLFYNKPPAKIYLGDAGSMLIGGIMGIYPFFLINKSLNTKFFILPLFILAIPFLELSALICIRIYKKIPFYLGSPDHFSIYLIQKGLSKNLILLFIVIISIFLFLISFLYIKSYINAFHLFILCITFLIIWFFSIYKNKL